MALNKKTRKQVGALASKREYPSRSHDDYSPINKFRNKR
jgi:hypothetical protein